MAGYQKLLAKYNLLTWESSTPFLLKLWQSFRVNLRAHWRTNVAAITDVQADMGSSDSGRFAGYSLYHEMNFVAASTFVKGET